MTVLGLMLVPWQMVKTKKNPRRGIAQQEPGRARGAIGMVVKKYKNADGNIRIEIDYDKCTGAAVCVDVCPSAVFELVKGKATAPNIDACVECCACVQNCPEGAIKHSAC
jgi:NAD-dependent dihydropyrimidine dehydrogenase PreA subunit